jgi:hypothetical protein
MLKAIGLDCDTTYEMDLDANQNTKIISANLWKNLKIVYRKNMIRYSAKDFTPFWLLLPFCRAVRHER